MRPPWAGADHARGVADPKFDAIVRYLLALANDG
jgi:hypothetical protein